MADTKKDPKPTETDIENKPEEEKDLDRDGRERQPTDVTDHK